MVVERGDQLEVARQQHPVAEHVAGHVADPDRGEVGLLDVTRELAEVALDRLPGAAGGDPHRLVVVSLRAAGGERVAEPEPVGLRDLVGDVREAGRALVGGDDQVRVVIVVADHAVGRHHLAGDDVVGHVKQSRQEQPVARDPLLGQLLATAAGRRALDHEPALGADRDDQRVLDHLRLHQPQHLGAEVLGAVRPAQPTAGDLAAAQVHSLEARRVHEDLELRARRGQERDPLGVELERQKRSRGVVLVDHEIVGAQRRAHHRLEAAQDPVLVEAGDRVDRLPDLGGQPLGSVGVAGVGIKPGAEQLDQQRGDVGMRQQRALHVGVRERDPRLAQVLGDRADDRDLTPAHRRAQHQAVEPVVLELAPARGQERRLEHLAHTLDVLGDAAQPEIVDPRLGRARRRDLIRALVDDLRAHVLERGEHVRERHRAGAEQLAAQRPDLVRQRPVQAHDRPAARGQLLDPVDVGNREVRRPFGTVSGRERPLVAAGQLQAAVLAVLGDKRGAQVIGPGAGGIDQPGLDLGDVVVVVRAVGRVDHVQHAREHRLRQLQRPVEMAAAERLHQDRGDAFSVLGVEAVARDRHQALDEPVERIAADEQPHALALPQPEDPHRDLEQLVAVHLKQRVARVGLEDLDERFAVVAGRREAGALEHALDLVTQERDLEQAGVVGGGCVEAEEASLADHLALGRVLLDADVVQVRRVVDGRARVGLGQHQAQRRQRQPDRLRAQPVERMLRGTSQDPQAGVGTHLQAGPVAVDHQVVLPVAQEREVVLGHPAQERLDLLDLASVHRRRPLVELVDQLVGALAHRAPVLDRCPHLFEYALDVVVQLEPAARGRARGRPQRAGPIRRSRPGWSPRARAPRAGARLCRAAPGRPGGSPGRCRSSCGPGPSSPSRR